MTAKSILYLGCGHGTAGDRSRALQRLGHKVVVVNPRLLLPRNILLDKWIFETGGLFLETLVAKRVLASLPSSSFDFVFVDGGQLVGPRLVRILQQRFGPVLSYNIDDPFGPRDGRAWRTYLQTVPFYDLVIVVRDCNIAEAKSLGARNVLKVYRAADEITHAPRPVSDSDRARWGSEVGFVGTWFPERGPFLGSLIRQGVPLSIWGNRWQRAKEWPLLRAAWRGPGPEGDDYTTAVQCVKVCLGLVSKENRDLSTTRSFEIPYMRGVFCAERTTEHIALYQENEEAVFWNTPEECAEKCKMLLADPLWRQTLAQKARQRCISNGTTNETIMARIVEAAVGLSCPRR